MRRQMMFIRILPKEVSTVQRLQIKLRKSLILEIQTIQNILISNYELVYPKLCEVLTNTSLSKDSSNSFIWHKLAKVMAIGYLEIELQHFIINGQKIHNESQAARLLSEYLYGNYSKSNSISSYLNQTKQKVKNENKNIFISSRLKDLKKIAADVWYVYENVYCTQEGRMV